MRQPLWTVILLAATAPLVRSQTNTPGLNPAVAKATASLQAAAPKAEADPTRPLYHFHAPAQWMNDPNGPIYYQGYYHLFYQCNPFGPDWGHMHWGHARSRDLVRWQHLPIALWPSEELGEEHAFSGCCLINPKGQPMIFYTSIQRNKPAELFAQQWAALGDKKLVTWQKDPANPVLTEALNGTTKIFDWRDPYVFQEKGRTYMVLGGNLNQRAGGKAIVTLYQADNDSLTRWRYLGILFTHPDPSVANIECPNLFRLGSKWVLIVSPHGPVNYFVGDLDLSKPAFRAERHGQVDLGGDFYAPNGLADSRHRHLLWGWIKGFEHPSGWNGCLSLPRVLSVEADGELRQRPAPELKKLRTDHFRLSDALLDNKTYDLSGTRGECLEIYTEWELLGAHAIELHVRRSEDGTRSIPIAFDGTALNVAGVQVPLHLHPEEKTLKLDLFLDRSVLELFANGRDCYTAVINPRREDLGVALAASGSAARVRSFHAWKMRPIW